MKTQDIKSEARVMALLLKVTRALREGSILRESIQTAIRKKIPPRKILEELKEQIDLGHRNTLTQLIGQKLVDDIDNFKFE